MYIYAHGTERATAWRELFSLCEDKVFVKTRRVGLMYALVRVGAMLFAAPT